MRLTENGEFNPENCSTALKDGLTQAKESTGKDFLLRPPRVHPQSLRS